MTGRKSHVNNSSFKESLDESPKPLPHLPPLAPLPLSKSCSSWCMSPLACTCVLPSPPSSPRRYINVPVLRPAQYRPPLPAAPRHCSRRGVHVVAAVSICHAVTQDFMAPFLVPGRNVYVVKRVNGSSAFIPQQECDAPRTVWPAARAYAGEETPGGLFLFHLLTKPGVYISSSSVDSVCGAASCGSRGEAPGWCTRPATPRPAWCRNTRACLGFGK